MSRPTMGPHDIPNAVVRIEVYRNPASGGFGIKVNTVGLLDLPSTIDVLAAAQGMVELQMEQEEQEKAREESHGGQAAE